MFGGRGVFGKDRRLRFIGIVTVKAMTIESGEEFFAHSGIDFNVSRVGEELHIVYISRDNGIVFSIFFPQGRENKCQGEGEDEN
jgi:hypothetical protein